MRGKLNGSVYALTYVLYDHDGLHFILKNTKLRGRGPQANYTDRANAA
jgi:hypothetical protein